MAIVAAALVGVLLLAADPGRAATTVLVMTGRTAIWLWSRSAKAVALVGRGGLAPGGGSFELLSSRPVLNDSGLVAFVAIVNRLPGLPTRNEAVGVFTVDGSGRVSEVLPAQP